MSAITRLNDYVQSVQRRLKHLRLWRGAAALAGAALAVTVVGVWMAMRHGFSGLAVNAARVILIAALAGVAIYLIVLPMRRLRHGAANELETRAPEFRGRLLTYFDARRRDNPLTELLAEDTLKVAEQFPPERQVRRRELRIPAALAVVCAGVLLWLAAAGPGLWGYGTRYLWAGWAMPDLKPAQSIAVMPGDQSVRRGGNVPIRAKAQGFAPPNARLHVQAEDGAWQEVDMTRVEEGFAFTMFSVREPTRYYVSAAGVRSPDYRLNVVDVPNIDNLRLTYRFPKWTGRKPETVEPGGDIRALKDTGIDLEVRADAPLPVTELVLDDSSRALQTRDRTGNISFDVQKDGRYFLAARVGSEQVRLTDDYFIKVVDDAPPELRIARPGRDYGASSIEEVTARVDANDDYGLQSLELRYSVNGGKWQNVMLPRKAAEDGRIEAEHVFALEALGNQQRAALKPGDLISYYAVAKDHSHTARTDMYFVDVKPFDRRFSQSQQSGGGAGGGNEQGEISRRQKEIIVSTWNLIREQGAESEAGDKIQDNAELLAELQTKLAAQAMTLAQRMQSRGLGEEDEQIAQFSKNIRDAVAAMKPAAAHLSDVELEQAIQPEQLALQHLLRAEAVFTDIQIAMQQGGQGGGVQDSRDLAQMYELEMDLNKNQYEAVNRASPETADQSSDELARKLQELARRQEQLANNARQQQQLTQEQRWQQESLRREAEELQRRVERMQQQANNRNSQNGQQGSQSQSGDTSDQSSGQSGTGQSELGQRLQSAIRAMNESSAAMGNAGSAEERQRAQRAAAEAQRQLAGARDALTREQQAALQASLGNMADRAARLYEQQAQFDRELQDRVRQQRSQNEEMSEDMAHGLANEKRAIAGGVQQLQTDMLTAARGLKEQAPQTAQLLDEANQDLRERDIDRRLAIAASYIERGAAPFVVASESAVTDGLRDLRENLRRAAAGTGGNAAPREDKVDEALARVRALRQELQQLANASAQARNGRSGGQPGQSQSPGQAGRGQEGQGQSSQGQSGQGQGGQTGQGAANGANSGQSLGGGVAPNATNGTNGWTGIGGNLGPSTDRTLVNARPGLRSDLTTAAREVRNAVGELGNRGRLTQQEAQRLQDITRQLEAANFSSDAQRLSGESNASLALLEQLELKLAHSRQGRNGDAGARANAAEPVPKEYENAVAEYYRRLSKD